MMFSVLSGTVGVRRPASVAIVLPTYSRYRIYITTSVGSTEYSALQEVDIYDGSLFNIKTQSTPTANSENPGQGADRTIDGNYQDYGGGAWATSSTTFPNWVAYQFSSQRTVRAFGISPQNFNDGPNRAPKDFEFQGSNDGTQWNTIVAYTGMTNGWAAGERRMFWFGLPVANLTVQSFNFEPSGYTPPANSSVNFSL